MNIIKNMFSHYFIDSNELQKLKKEITVRIHDKTGSYYFSNVHNIDSDMAYAKLLDLRADCYRSIIYENVEYKSYSNSLTFMFKNKVEAESKKVLLCILLLNKYKTADNVIAAIKRLRDLANSR